MKRVMKAAIFSVNLLVFASGISIRAQARSDAEIANNAVACYAEIKGGIPVASGALDVVANGKTTGWTAVLDAAELYEPAAARFAESRAESAVSVVRMSLPAPAADAGSLRVSLWSPEIREGDRLKAYRYANGTWAEIPTSVRKEHADLDMTGNPGGIIMVAKYPAFRYVHDPARNPNVLRDAVVNPDAVYGFSPNPGSTRLKDYVDALDWTDPEEVEKAKKEQEAYHRSMAQLYRTVEQLRSEGKDIETIARTASALRNQLRLESYQGDPAGLARVKSSNLATYGNENGPTADSLYAKHGSWQRVLEGALSSNAGMDACLGLYDTYYDIHEMTK